MCLVLSAHNDFPCGFKALQLCLMLLYTYWFSCLVQIHTGGSRVATTLWLFHSISCQRLKIWLLAAVSYCQVSTGGWKSGSLLRLFLSVITAAVVQLYFCTDNLFSWYCQSCQGSQREKSAVDISRRIRQLCQTQQHWQKNNQLILSHLLGNAHTHTMLIHSAHAQWYTMLIHSTVCIHIPTHNIVQLLQL